MISFPKPLNGVGHSLASAFAKKEAIQDMIYGVSNASTDDLLGLLARADAIDRWDHASK